MNMILRKNEILADVLTEVFGLDLVGYSKYYVVNNAVYKDTYEVLSEGDENDMLDVNTFIKNSSGDLILYRRENYYINKNNTLKYIVSDQHIDQIHQLLDENGNIIYRKYSFIDTTENPVKVTKEETFHRTQFYDTETEKYDDLITSYTIKEFYNDVFTSSHTFEISYMRTKRQIKSFKVIRNDILNSTSNTSIYNVEYNDINGISTLSSFTNINSGKQLIFDYTLNGTCIRATSYRYKYINGCNECLGVEYNFKVK